MPQHTKAKSETPAKQPQAADLIHRSTGDPSHPTLIYLPGVHGDWTPQSVAAPILAQEFRLIETAYPKNSHWTLNDFAEALIRLLDSFNIPSAHIAAESFGSLVGLNFALQHPARVLSLTLVGGFSRAPEPRVISITKWGLGRLSTRIFERGVDAYCALRGRSDPRHPSATNFDIPYEAVRTEEGRQATVRRLEIISRSDLRHQLHHIQLPVRYIGGEHDLIVPTKREIRTFQELLPKEADFQSHLIPKALHMIIASHPQETAQQITDWIQALPDT